MKNGDFAYNRSYSKDYPYGAIKRLDNYECGVVSTLYIVFEPKSNVNSNYLKYYFETDKWNGQISLISGEGARNHGLLNLSPSDFFQTKHWIPSLDEQSEISVFLEKIFILESLLEQKLLTLKKYKEGLIQEGFKLLDHESRKIPFGDLFKPINIRNKELLVQYTVGKNGLKLLDEGNYDISNHKTFSNDCLILGIGIEEIGISEKLSGSISPVYSVYKINNPNQTKYFKYFLKPYLWKNKKYFTRKSTRREYEIDSSELSEIIIQVPNSNIFDFLIKSLETIDKLIDIEERLLCGITDTKSFLLKNMFI